MIARRKPVMSEQGPVNLLLRGQSNAQIFAGSGIYAVEQQLEAQFGVKVNILAEYGTDNSTIHAGTAFLDWDTDGEQASLIRYLEAQSADVRDNPTVTVWMHNEYEQQGLASKEQWLNEVRADFTLVRGVLNQSVETTPYVFVPVPYNYGQNWEWLKGMEALASDPSFNATMSDAFTGTVMDGDGYANSSHMGEGDVSLVAAALSRTLSPVLSQLTMAPLPVVIPPPEVAPQAPKSSVAGAGSDVLVLHVAQDAYQGDAQYSVRVDGQAFGETFIAGALHDAGLFDTLTLYGNWGTGSDDVEITLLVRMHGAEHRTPIAISTSETRCSTVWPSWMRPKASGMKPRVYSLSRLPAALVPPQYQRHRASSVRHRWRPAVNSTGMRLPRRSLLISMRPAVGASSRTSTCSADRQ